MRRFNFIRMCSYLSFMAVLLVVCLGRPAQADVSSAVSYAEISTPTGVLNTWNGYLLGAGAAIEDLDNDGDAEILLLNAVDLPNRLFENRGDAAGNGYPEMVEITTAAGLENLGNSKGIVIADYNNDGLKDIFVSSYDERVDNLPVAANYSSSLTLYHNNGDGTFTNITASAGLTVTGIAAFGLSAADVDNDGWIDIYLSNRGGIDEIAQGGGFNLLFHNNGDGTFADVSGASGITDVRAMTFQSGFFDYDNDGDQDFYLCTDKSSGAKGGVGNQLYRNNGQGVFENVSAISQSDIKMDGMCVAIGDYDNDLDLDVFITNIPEGHALLRNNNDGTFTERAALAGVLGNRIGWGASWLDADNDGKLDLYVVGFGQVSQNQLFLNNGNSTFTDIAASAGCEDPASGFGLAKGDLNADGRADFIVSNQSATNGLFQHSGTAGASVRFQFVGIESNRDAIGTRVYLHAGSTTQLREVRAGDSYLSHSQLEQLFGLGGENPDRIEIRWPSGLQQTVDALQAGGRYRIVEGRGIQTATMLIDQSVQQGGDEVTLQWETVQWPSDQGFLVKRIAVDLGNQVTTIGEISDAGRWFSMTDGFLAEGTYRYQVFVVDESDQTYLLWETADLAVNPTPVRLSGFEVATEQQSVKLQWRLDAAAIAELRGVYVQRAMYADGPFTDITPQGLLARLSMTYTDTAPPVDKDLWYRLRFAANNGLQELSPALHISGVGLFDHRSRILQTRVPGAGPVQISFALGQAGLVRVQLFDIRGRLVNTLVDDDRNAGRYSLSWNRLDRAGRPVARGLYLLQLRSKAGNDARKLVLQQR